jgi:phosphohistidine swiveling domain-containing protein
MREATVEAGSGSEGWDNLNLSDPQDLHWTTDNVGEAAPGVLTPLSGSFWGPVGDTMPRRVAYAMGVYSRPELVAPSPSERAANLFFGRLAMKVEYLASIGDRLPGTSGEEAVRGLFGKVPESISFEPTKRRYPVIAVKFPYEFLTNPRRLRALVAETEAWWRRGVPELANLDRGHAAGLLADAYRRFDHILIVHSVCLFTSAQTMYDALGKLVEEAGVGDAGALSGSGGAEMAIVSDIWKAARGQIDLGDVIANHGFHGPLEGEMSSRVWREDPEPLRRLIVEYAARDDSEDPGLRERRRAEQAEEMRREVIAALPASRRTGARLTMRLAAERIPLRGVGKRAFLQAMDMARGSARVLGERLAADDVLADPGDVFYLTCEELTRRFPFDARELVTKRRERRAYYQSVKIPASWRGTPEPEPIESDSGRAGAERIEGIGVSSGVIEGLVRVVTDPSFGDIEPDEVLVSPTTDPSWSSIMFVSSALVVDIGGPMSHAAVVARELGLPCVVNTRSGSSDLRTGDRVKVDGSAGTVEVLERAA